MDRLITSTSHKGISPRPPLRRPLDQSATRAWEDLNGWNLDSLVRIPVDHRVCYYPGIVHGGLLTTLIEEAFTTCGSPALPSALQFEFLDAIRPGSTVIIRVRTLQRGEREVSMEGTLEKDDERGTVIVRARALFRQEGSAGTKH